MDEKPSNAPSALLPPPVVAFVPSKRPRLRRIWSSFRKQILSAEGPNSSLGDPTTESASSASSLRHARQTAEAEGAGAPPGFVDEVVVDQHLAPEEWQKAAGGTLGSERAGTDTKHGTMRASDEDSVMEKEPGDAFGPVGRLCAGVLWPKIA